MCGIAGIISHNSHNVTPQLLEEQCRLLAHRGPDGQRTWISPNQQVGFAHTRLSIIDLSEQAAQPMHYLDRYTIVFNGEIYNYIELKSTLVGLGYDFASASDTEVILAAYDCWGDECVEKLDGMFAFAILDQVTQIVFAARDRFGEKPFYFYSDDEYFIFASEMKAIWGVGIEKKADPKMLLNYLTLGYVQNPNNKERTFFENILSLAPGCYLLIDVATLAYERYHYWDIDKEFCQKTISISNATEQFESLLTTSIQRRLRSDVSIGSSLSGGIDSSAIAAFMHALQQPPNNFSSFTAIFPGFDKNEEAYSKEVAQQMGIVNYTVAPTIDGFLADFEKLSYHQEEPYSSSSIYAQYKVFELAAEKGVKVLMDGQGADETLAGYNRYIHWYLQELISRGGILKAIKAQQQLTQNNFSFKWSGKNYVAAIFPAHVALKLEQNEFARTMNHPDINKDFVQSLRGREWEGIHKPIINKLNDILYFNTHNLGLEELLRFADRNSMAHGREVRLPFLNHELVQFIFSLPAHFKIHDGWTKWILRNTVKDKLPGNIVWRKDKVGYEPPQQQWMQTPPLQEYIQEARRKLVNKGVLNSQVLNRPIVPLPAHEGANFDWRYLSAAQSL